MRFTTNAIHIGNEPNTLEGGSGDVVVPIHLATTFAREKVLIPTAGYDYSRSGNPTRAALEKNLACLEHGSYAFAYTSGLAAITNVLFLLKPGDHILAIDNLYGGTYRLFTQIFQAWGISLSLVSFSQMSDLAKHIQRNTKLIYLESPTNPLLKIIDLQSTADFAKKYNILTAIDNTFASPYWQNPLDFGIDIVIHSATKYLGGHSDVTAGCVIVNDDTLAHRLGFLQNAIGAILSPFDSYNLLKGIKTLPIRMKEHEMNTQKVVNFLQSHKKIKTIYYPGLVEHPGHHIAKKQMRGFGGILSFELLGDITNTIQFLEKLTLIHLAISVGAVESLIEHPATMTHAAVPKEERERCGLSDTLIRLSVGLEDSDDLLNDLSQALDSI